MQTLVTTLPAVECNPCFAHSFVSQKLCQSGQTLLPGAGDAIHPALRLEWSGSRDYKRVAHLYAYFINYAHLTNEKFTKLVHSKELCHACT